MTDSKIITRTKIVKRLRDISKKMMTLGADMDYYGGFSEIGEKGREMVGAGNMAKAWADAIEIEEES